MEISVATGTLAALLVVAAPPALGSADEPVAGLRVDRTSVEPGITLGVTGDGFVQPDRCELQALGQEWNCELGPDGASGSMTIGTNVEPGTYEVRLCVPHCDAAWAGVTSASLAVQRPEDPGNEDPGNEDPGNGNPAFPVTPTDRAVLPTAAGAASLRSYTATVPDGTVVAVQLFPASAVRVSDGRVLIATSGTGPATTVLRERTPAQVVVVNGTAVVGAASISGVRPIGGRVTFTVASSAPTEVTPLVFADEDGDGTLELAPAETPGAATEPTEPFGVGGPVAFTPAAATEALSQRVPPPTVPDSVTPVRVRLLAAADETLQLSPTRAEPGDTVQARAPALPSPGALARCELRWGGIAAGGRCQVDENGQLTGSLRVPADAAIGEHELTACYPTCSPPFAERRTLLVPVQAVAGVPPQDDTESDWLVTVRTAVAAVPMWAWAVLVAGVALLAGVGASLANALRHPPMARLVPVPDPDPEVRVEVQVPAQRMPTLRLQAIPDERPTTITTEVEP